MEQSVYLIRPEGLAHRQAMRAMIEADGLRIVDRKTIVLPPEALPVLYEDVNQEFWDYVRPIMCRGLSEIGIVEGEGAVQRLRYVVGWSPNPKECGLHTIRARFGGETYRWLPGGNPYFSNPIHAPRTKKEATRDLALARELMAPGT